MGSFITATTWAPLPTATKPSPGTKPKPKSTITCELKDVNHLKFALKSSRVVVVKAEADWCEPCKVLAPKYEELATNCANIAGGFSFFTDDVDKETSPHAAKVTAVPTFFVYTDGNPTPKKIFTGDFDQLSELLKKIYFRFKEDMTKQPVQEDVPSEFAQSDD